MRRKPPTGGEANAIADLVNTSFLIPRDIQRALRFMAADNERTLSAEVRAALAAHVAEARKVAP